MSRHDRSDPHSQAETPYPLRRLFLRGAALSLCAGLVGLMPAFQAAITGSVEQAFADRTTDLHRLLLERASGEATPAAAKAALEREVRELCFACIAMPSPSGQVDVKAGRGVAGCRPRRTIRSGRGTCSSPRRRARRPPETWRACSRHPGRARSSSSPATRRRRRRRGCKASRFCGSGR